ncbi:MAG: SDR family NAD(P)-dependent oxidoreductase [Candidatus Binataceae bacterium]
MDRLAGKKTIITGAAGGQGRVACKMFADEGASIVATDLHPDAARQIEAIAPGKIHYVAADLVTEAGIDAVISSARQKFGKIDVLYNNHGIILGRPFLETTRAEWDRVQDTDLKSFYFLTQKVTPHMTERASIINTASGLGHIAAPNASAYCAAKAGLINLTRCLALELAPRGIRANVICPGVIDTPMPRVLAGDAPDKEAVVSSFLERQIMKHLGRPEDIVRAAIYLASDESSFSTGAVFNIDGGISAW